MPYNFNEYAAWCREWDDNVLQEEYQKYVRATAQSSTGAAVGYGLAVFTLGISLIGVAASGATLANAATKLDIIRTEMARRKKKHKLKTRPQDVFGGIALGSTGLISTPIEHVLGPALLNATSSSPPFYHGHISLPSHDYYSRVER